ncbi:hypothetical protein BP6252_06432 [Coleophoma cylindrospora]|uniref:Uncharacterized protein n=1 Tax=Coleophoma cylindrospora TaxID=1849047 RepID=A0A3D8RMX4_9HELO|nr:hypothetical protein BP6252_06432 [Coleophoma cylindrospora]
MFLGRMLAARREDPADMQLGSQDRKLLVDEITQNLGKLQESARHQFLKIHVGGYRWYHADTYEFPDPAAFQNSRGTPRIDRWSLADLLALEDALKHELISVECKRKRRVDEVEKESPKAQSDLISTNSKHEASGNTAGMDKLLRECEVLRDRLANADIEVNKLRAAELKYVSELDKTKQELLAAKGSSQTGLQNNNTSNQLGTSVKNERFAELDTLYDRWKSADGPEFGFVKKIFLNNMDLMNAARSSEGSNKSFNSSPATQPARVPLPSLPTSSPQFKQEQVAPFMSQELRPEEPSFMTPDRSSGSRAKTAKKSENDNDIPAADLTFIMTCLQHCNGGTISVNIPAVARALNYTNPKSVTNKLAFMRKRYNIPVTGARVRSSDGNEEGRRSSSGGSAKSKSKLRENNEHDQAFEAGPDFEAETLKPVSPTDRIPIDMHLSKTPDERPVYLSVNGGETSSKSEAVIPALNAHGSGQNGTSKDAVTNVERIPVKRGFVPVNGDVNGSATKKQHVESED